MKRFLIVILYGIGCYLLTSAVSYAGAAELIISRPGGTINWTLGIVSATGFGTPSNTDTNKHGIRRVAESAAEIAAKENMLKLIQGIHIDSKRTVGEIMASNQTVRKAIAAMVEGLKPVKTVVSNGSSGFVKIKLKLNLFGDFARVVLPPEIKEIESIKTIRSKPAPAVHKTNTTNAPLNSLKAKKEVYTGLIVDARGLKEIGPTMVPKILDESGQQIYGPEFASRQFAVQMGICLYIKDPASARIHPRIGDHPLVVKGIKNPSSNLSTIVVSNSDAAKLRTSSSHLSFLRRCRVIIVLD
ncbi:MAG: hypothetical protein JRH18_21405 [Deltaproteobacteria bacterium]|nr:hypothetical protein [Deltaproteobacteria bacterium]MBW2154209.1 hypothetical protein [Deltaproteobacteria bacterium]